MDGLCQRYSKLPDEIRNADTYLYRMIATLHAAGELGGDTAAPDEPHMDLPMEAI